MNKFKYILSSAILTLFLFGCEAEKPSQDPEDIGSTDRYPTPSFTLTGGSTSFNERDEPVFVYDIVFDRVIDRPVDFTFEQIGGDAELHTDYDLVPGTVPAFQNEAQISVVIHRDGEFEGTESLVLKVVSGPSLANTYLVNPDTNFPTLDLTIENWLVCVWTLFCSDTYGDGWNGGHVNVDIDGVVTEYVAEETTSTYEVLIPDGSSYSFEYVSGGGTGAGPGWESENYYSLTAPDGTFWEDGSMDYSSIPAEGIITDGINACP